MFQKPNSKSQLNFGNIFMLKTILALLFLSISFESKSQDTVFLKSGETLIVEIAEVNEQFIEYHAKLENRTVLSAIHLKDVYKICYANGDVVLVEFKEPPKTYTDKDIAYYEQLARGDARMSYKDYKKSSRTTVASTLILSPVFGIIPTRKMYKKVPEMYNLNFPDSTLIDNKIYTEAYQKESHEIKKEKLKVAYGASSFGWLFVVSVIFGGTFFLR